MSGANESEVNQDAIAIVGMAVRLPGASNLDEFWSLLKEGREAIKFFSPEELIASGIAPEKAKNPEFIASRGYLDDIDAFDAAFFGISPREAALVDPQHRIMMQVAWHAMEHAGYDPEQWDGNCAVFTSAGMNTYLPFNIFTNPGLIEQVGGFQLSIYNDKDFVPTRIAYALNSKGPAIDIGTACSSSLVGVHMGCQQLLSFQSDLVLVGGVTIHLPQETGDIHQPGSAYSPDGHCRPFDAAPSGLVDGNGAAAVVLKRLEDAIKDGDTIHAVIRGSAINNDGSDKVGYTAPSIDGQAQVILEAQALAGVESHEISYVEAHGTATPLGDPIEVAGLTQAFRQTSDDRQFCGLGSVKSNIGHVDKAAGLAGLIKVVLCLENELLAPSLHYHAPNPRLDLENSPFYVVAETTAWPRTLGQPRIAAISSFGVGGTNAHAILEEAPAQPIASSQDEGRPELIVLSAQDEHALYRSAEQLAAFVSDMPHALVNIARTLQIGRKPKEIRAAWICSDKIELKEQLLSFVPAQGVLDEPGVVFLFSGQGTQHVGMARALYQTQPVFREWLDRCADILLPILGQDLRELIYGTEASEETLRQTQFAQPAIFSIEYALARLLLAWGVRPKAVLGHSIGEYVAACIAGLFNLETALSLVAARGRLMQSMPKGAMLAASITESELLADLQELGLDLAAVNTANQCVASGPLDHIEKLQARLSERGVITRALDTSHAFHSRMMEPMLDEFSQQLNNVSWQVPSIPIFSNLTGSVIPASEISCVDYWCNHLRNPVRFHQSLQALENHYGNQIWLEIGPGRTLTGMAALLQRTAPESANLPTLPPATSRIDADRFLLGSIGKLWAHGVNIDWDALCQHAPVHRVPLPLYPFDTSRYWIEPGSGFAGKQGAFKEDANPTHWFYSCDWHQQTNGSPVLEGNQRVLIAGQAEKEWHDEITRLYRALGHQVIHELDENEAPTVLLYLLPEDMEKLSIADALQPIMELTQRLLTQPKSVTHNIRIVLVGSHMLNLGEANIEATRAALLGILRTLPYEYAELECLAIDITSALDPKSRQQLARRLVHETLQTAPPHAVVLRNGARWVQRFAKQTIPEKADYQHETGGIYWVLGGLSDIGLVIAEALVQRQPSRLILTHEGEDLAAVTQQIQATEKWKHLGIDIIIKAVQTEDSHAFLEFVREHTSSETPITGMIDASDFHAEKPFGLMQALEMDSLRDYWKLQHQRLESLRLASLELQPDYCMVMSSLSAQIGGTGQLASATQGLYVEAFVQKQNQTQTIPWSVIFWGQWSTSDQSSITPDKGKIVLERLFDLECPGNLLIAPQNPQTAQKNRPITADAPLSNIHSKQHDRPNLATAYQPPEDAHQQRVTDVWQRFLGISSVGIDDDFFDLGGNSLLASQLISEINQTFSIKLELTTLFSATTVRDLSGMILSAQIGDQDLESLGSELERLEALSDEEAAALLEEMGLKEDP